MNKRSDNTSPDRREFLGRMSTVTAAAFAAGAIGLEPLLGSATPEARAAVVGTAMVHRRLRPEAFAGHIEYNRTLYNENFGGFSLTKYDGTTVTV
jgi:hypothetical protein